MLRRLRSGRGAAMADKIDHAALNCPNWTCRTSLSCWMISALFRVPRRIPLHHSKAVTTASSVRQLARLRRRRVQHPAGLARKPLGNLVRRHRGRTGPGRNPRVCAPGIARPARSGCSQRPISPSGLPRTSHSSAYRVFRVPVLATLDATTSCGGTGSGGASRSSSARSVCASALNCIASC